MSVVSPEYSGFIHKTDRRDITEILLKMALNTISLNLKPAPGSGDLKSSEINKDVQI